MFTRRRIGVGEGGEKSERLVSLDDFFLIFVFKRNNKIAENSSSESSEPPEKVGICSGCSAEYDTIEIDRIMDYVTKELR